MDQPFLDVLLQRDSQSATADENGVGNLIKGKDDAALPTRGGAGHVNSHQGGFANARRPQQKRAGSPRQPSPYKPVKFCDAAGKKPSIDFFLAMFRSHHAGKETQAAHPDYIVVKALAEGGSPQFTNFKLPANRAELALQSVHAQNSMGNALQL